MSETQAVTVVESQEVVKQEAEIGRAERYRGISQEAVSAEKAAILMAPVDDSDIEIRPDGMIYLPEIKYRRRLNQTFGPGGWALMPTSKFDMRDGTIMRQYALYAGGRFISEAVGEQEYIQNNPNMTYATAAEGCKSNALMRCCKDLGIASELWDPGFIANWVPKFALKIWNTKTSKFNWRRKDREPFFWEKKEAPKAKESGEETPQPAEDQPSSEAPDDAVITEPQRKRLYAIARGAGLNDDQFRDEMVRLGYQSSKDVKKSHYQDICSHFDSMRQGN